MTNSRSGNWSDSLGSDSFSLTDAIGGWRGAVEALVPGLVFVIVFVATGNLGWTVGASAGLSVLFCLLRLLQREPLTQALAGLLGVLIGVVWALGSGKAENYFAWGLITNAAYGGALLISIIFRQPLGAWALTFLWNLPRSWIRDDRSSLLYRRALAVSWIWFGVFALRLVTQLPFYLAGNVAVLGVVKLLMGLPLFGLAAWATWVLLRHQKPAQQVTEGDSESEGGLS